MQTDQTTFTFDEVIFAIGRTPNTDNIDIETTGIKLAKSGIVSVENFKKLKLKIFLHLEILLGNTN